MSPDSQNVRTDQTAGIQPRLGFTSFSTEPSKNIWPFSHSNGTKYVITQSSNILKANIGDGVFSIGIATVDPNVTTVGAQLGDNFFFSNVTNGLKYWDSNNVFTGSTTMKFTQMVAHKGRLVGSGKPASERIIFGSRFNDGTFWNLVINPAETDPFQIQVGGGLDEVLTTLYSSYRDKLIWAKASSFGALNGSRRSNFKVETFSEVVGTAYPDSMRDCDGELRWLGNGGIVWGFDGSNLKDLTKYDGGGGIKNLMETIAQGEAASRIWTQTSKSDWDQGVKGVRIRTDLFPGDAVFASTSFAEGFGNGPCSTSINEPVSCAPRWTTSGNSGSGVTISLAAGGSMLNVGAQSGAFASSDIFVGTWTFTGDFWNGAAGEGGKIFFICPATSAIPTYCSQGYFLHVTGSGGEANGQAPFADYFLKEVGGGTLISTENVQGNQITSIDFTRNGSGLFTMFLNGVGIGSATDVTFSSSNFILAQFDENSPFKLGSVDIKDGLMFSTFTSQSFNVGNKITSWGAVTISESLDSAQIKHVLFVSSMSQVDPHIPSSYTSSQAIANNEIPSIATGPFVLISSSFSKTARTNQPLLSDFSIRWSEGVNLRAASIYTDGRYKLSVSISSTANNTLLVFDRRGQWQVDKGINADVTATYNSNPYFGNSSGIWLDESGTSDNGASISSFYKTKSYFPGGLPYQNTFKSLFMTTENSGSTLATTYQVDGVNTDYSLASRAMDAVGGFQLFNLPFSTTNLKRGRTISFTWTVSSAVDWRILGAELFFDSEKVIRAN